LDQLVLNIADRPSANFTVAVPRPPAYSARSDAEVLETVEADCVGKSSAPIEIGRDARSGDSPGT
jgi:hypothetical protein